jgi:Na+/glutamate symporter
MNGLISNIEKHTIRVRFDSDISKVLILNIFGTVELEKSTEKGKRLIVDIRYFSSGQYIIQFLKNEIVVDGLKMAIKK